MNQVLGTIIVILVIAGITESSKGLSVNDKAEAKSTECEQRFSKNP